MAHNELVFIFLNYLSSACKGRATHSLIYSEFYAGTCILKQHSEVFIFITVTYNPCLTFVIHFLFSLFCSFLAFFMRKRRLSWFLTRNTSLPRFNNALTLETLDLQQIDQSNRVLHEVAHKVTDPTEFLDLQVVLTKEPE